MTVSRLNSFLPTENNYFPMTKMSHKIDFHELAFFFLNLLKYPDRYLEKTLPKKTSI